MYTFYSGLGFAHESVAAAGTGPGESNVCVSDLVNPRRDKPAGVDLCHGAAVVQRWCSGGVASLTNCFGEFIITTARH